MLIGADPTHVEDRCIRVTIHHCFFDGTRQRHPRVRFGKVHLYNNYTRNWGIYAVCASVESQVLSFFDFNFTFHNFCMCNSCALNFVLTDDSFLHLCSFLFQILSQCNIYEAGEKKAAFKYLTEKVFPWAYRKFSVK